MHEVVVDGRRRYRLSDVAAERAVALLQEVASAVEEVELGGESAELVRLQRLCQEAQRANDNESAAVLRRKIDDLRGTAPAAAADAAGTPPATAGAVALARDLNIPLDQVPFKGPRITKADVEAASLRPQESV